MSFIPFGCNLSTVALAAMYLSSTPGAFSQNLTENVTSTAVETLQQGLVYSGENFESTFESAIYRSGKLSLVLSLTNKGDDPLKFHLNARQNAIQFQSANGLLCRSDGWLDASIHVSNMNDEPFEAANATEVAPDDSVIFSIRSLNCNDGLAYDPKSKSMLKVRIIGKIGDADIKTDVKFNNVPVLVGD